MKRFASTWFDQLRDSSFRPARSVTGAIATTMIPRRPIPGTKRVKYLEENAGAVDVSLTSEDLRRIDEIAPKGVAAGTRYPEAGMAAVNR